MSYHFQGMGAAAAPAPIALHPWFGTASSVPATPEVMYGAYGGATPLWMQKPERFLRRNISGQVIGFGARCPPNAMGTEGWGCPCPDGWRYQQVDWVDVKDPRTGAITGSTPPGSISVTDPKTGKSTIVPRVFRCVPSSTDCGLDQKRYPATLQAYRVEIGADNVVRYFPEKAQTGEYCFDKDWRPDDGAPASHGPRYSCEQRLEACQIKSTHLCPDEGAVLLNCGTCKQKLDFLNRCKTQPKTAGCSTIRADEGLIRLNCAKQGGYNEPDTGGDGPTKKGLGVAVAVAAGAVAVGALVFFSKRRR